MNNRVSTIVFWVLGAANLALTVLLLVLLVMGFANGIDMTAVSGIVAGLSVSVFSWIGWLRQNEETKRAKAERSTAEIEYYYQSGLSDSVFAIGMLAKEVWVYYKRRKDADEISSTASKTALISSMVIVVLQRLTETVSYFRNLFPKEAVEHVGDFVVLGVEENILERKEMLTYLKVIGESANRIKDERDRLDSLMESGSINHENIRSILEKIKEADESFSPIAELINTLD